MDQINTDDCSITNISANVVNNDDIAFNKVEDYQVDTVEREDIKTRHEFIENGNGVDCDSTKQIDDNIFSMF